MTAGPVSSWTAYIKELHQWVCKQPTNKPSPWQVVRHEKLGVAVDSPPLPHAVLKRLVNDVQVKS
jgi:hypothetical protein